MERASSALEDEISALEKEAEEILADVKTTIGDLSDLRYGKFNRVSGVSSDLSQEVVQSLSRLENLCDGASEG